MLQVSDPSIWLGVFSKKPHTLEEKVKVNHALHSRARSQSPSTALEITAEIEATGKSQHSASRPDTADSTRPRAVDRGVPFKSDSPKHQQ